MVTRGGDNTMKVWDIRVLSTNQNSTSGRLGSVKKLPSLLTSFDDLPNYYSMTDIIMSPNDDLVVTGTSSKKKEGCGLLVMYDKQTWSRVKQIGVCEGGSVIRVRWNEFCNQIIVGCSDGVIRMYYDPQQSQKGAMLCAGKTPRPKDDYEYTAHRPIYTPHAILKDDNSKSSKRKREKMRQDPIKSRLPDPPTQGPLSRLHSGSCMTQHLMRGLIKNTMRDEDPRDAILRHAQAAAENPHFTAAYLKTQPTVVFHTEEEEKEEE
jgi:WD repeat-containing protein 70